MAEESHNKIHETTEAPLVETHDRGVFDFLGKKSEEKPQEEVIATEFEKIKVSEHSETKVEVEEPKHEEGEKKHSLLEKLHRSDSSSSSSSDEDEGEGGEKKKKKKKDKKGLKEKIKEKIGGKEEEGEHGEDTTVPVETCDAELDVQLDAAASNNPEEKKGFLEKIKDKLPGQHKKSEEAHASSEHAVPAPIPETVAHDGEVKEKKGIFEKIKEKLPGYHTKTEEVKEKDEKVDASH